MSSHPLTHHEIVGLIEPFSRQGYQADLGASQRQDRRLAFRPVEHPGALARVDLPAIGVVETLTLQSRAGGSYRLERRLALANGPDAMLVAEGAEPDVLLERLRRIGPAQPFEAGPGFCIGFSGRVEGPDATVALTEAVAHVGHWRFTVEADPVRGMAADVTLVRTRKDSAAVPEDLLAVLGRDWGLLRPASQGWAGSVRLRGRRPARDATTRQRVLGATRHLAVTFAAPPPRFHEAHRRARRLVALRRVAPLAAAFLLIGVGAACARLDISSDATLRVLLMSSPPVLMILFFSLREVPRLELPPMPRTANAGQWPVDDPGRGHLNGSLHEC